MCRRRAKLFGRFSRHLTSILCSILILLVKADIVYYKIVYVSRKGSKKTALIISSLIYSSSHQNVKKRLIDQEKKIPDSLLLSHSFFGAPSRHHKTLPTKTTPSTMVANDNSSSSSSSDEAMEEKEEEIGEQIRVSFVLDSSVSDRSLQVPSEPIAIPADLKRKGLSAVINHLLDRHDESDDGDENEQALPFDFIVANRLLRTGVEQAARRFGLSLEQAIQISYFPAQPAPEISQQGEPEPDWIGTIAYKHDFVYTGGYDGSIVIHNDAN